MQATSSTSEHGVSAIHGATLQQTRWWETTYSTVSWDYPPSPAAYYDALLSRGASHSRFLRIAYLSTRHPSSPSAFCSSSVSHSLSSFPSPLDTPPSSSNPHSTSTTPSMSPDDSHRKPTLHLSPTFLSRSCVNVRPRSANPMAHTLKRRKPQWPKPPHYHAALLRSPLSHRKGLFRAVLPPNKAVDFFRWDVLVGAGVSWSASCQERDWTRSGGDACAYASLRVAESVLEPYEAAAGFFGWHGLGFDVARRVRGKNDDERCWDCERDDVDEYGPSELRLEVDEAAVDEGRARWARTAQDLVGPPGLVLRLVVEDRHVTPMDPAHKDIADVHPSSVQWDPDMGSSPFQPTRATSAFDEKRQSPPLSSKPKPKSDSPSVWWHGPSPHRGPPATPHVPSLRFLPPPSIQYGPPPTPFPPWFPGGRVTSGPWYGLPPIGVPPVKSLPPRSHVFTTPATPFSIHPSQSPRYSTKPSLGQDEYGPGHDCDKETETDHGYESTTTTTDSDPPPHTPVGAATTSHCVKTHHGDDEVDVHGVEIDEAHIAASATIRTSTPVKLPDRFSTSTSPALSSDSLDSHREARESAKAVAVVFPSLNGSFCQGASQPSVALSSSTPVRTVTPVSSSSLSSTKEEEELKMKRKSGGPEASVPGDGRAFTPSVCSPPRPGLRKDSQGFWEPVTPVSPSSSSSSLPLSPSDGKTGSRSTVRWIGDRTGPMPGDACEWPELPTTLMLSAKSRSLSPGVGHDASVGSTRSSSSWPASFSSPTSTSGSGSVFGGSHPSSPSPPNGSSLIPPTSSQTVLLPAFLATATVKRKKASRTREIVDRLRSSSIDAGKGCAGLDSLGWLASPGAASGEVEGKLVKASSSDLNHVAGHHVVGGQPSASVSGPSQPQSGADSRLDSGKEGQATGLKADAGASGSGRRCNGAATGSVTHFSQPSSKSVTTTTNPSITPFPILSASPSAPSNFVMTRQSPTVAAIGRDPVITMLTKSTSTEGLKMNPTVATSPIARNSGLQLTPGIPNGTSPSARPCHPPLPSPSHPTVHTQPPLGPPPILAVSAYPQPVYVPFTQYPVAPAHQGQQGQGTWVAVYPGRPPHVPVHPIPAQMHVAPITGVSGMKHVSW